MAYDDLNSRETLRIAQKSPVMKGFWTANGYDDGFKINASYYRRTRSTRGRRDPERGRRYVHGKARFMNSENPSVM